MKNKLFQSSLVLTLVVLLVLLCDPFMLWMPPVTGMLVLLVATLGVCVWAGFVMMEKVVDERDVVHRMHASRISYLLGLAVLTLALLFQGFAHKIDPWVVLAIGVMVVTKFISRLYFEKNA